MELLNSILSITALLIGYYIGRGEVPKPISATVAKLKEKLDSSPVGVVKRPTQKDLLARNDPYHKKLKEGEDAMKETLQKFEDIPELK